MVKIGILGGTRFIGYHLMKAALKKGWSVSIFNSGITKPPEPLPSEIEVFRGNRNSGKGLVEFFKNDYDAIIDFSGHSPLHLKPIIENYRKKIGHYIFTSTVDVYKTPATSLIDENGQRTLETGTYGGDKALAEDALLNLWKTEKFPVTIFRPSGVFGEFDAGPQAGYVFSRLKNNLPVLFLAKGAVQFNPLYVHDLVEAYVKAIENPVSHGKIYNLAGDNSVYLVDFINTCAKISAEKLNAHIILQQSYPNLKIGLPWPDYSLVLNNNLVKQELGIKFTPLEDALAKTWKWLNENS